MKFLWAPWRIRFILENLSASNCIFCTLPANQDDRSSLILGRTKHSFAILNKFPYNSGHLMIVPLRHTADLSDLSEVILLDLHRCIRDSLEILKETMKPQGFNVGMNLGEAGGAGIRQHLHYHVLPRWNGDTNFLPAIGETKVLPESLEETYARLAPAFHKKWGSPST
ncbi:MAG TPA: HIT domain-containing protein [Bdellovibrionota bacterium]|nr:HIT domain-containing protein [Bdellovibrionota bacterium]